MHARVQDGWVPAETSRVLPEPLPGRIAVPLIGMLCAVFWLAVIAAWRAVG